MYFLVFALRLVLKAPCSPPVAILFLFRLTVPLREIVLGRLSALVKKFVRDVSLSKGLSDTAANAAGGKIFTFGSYRLGVHGPGTDIDTVCVVPKHVTREDFFQIFEPMLRTAEGATEVAVCLPHFRFPLSQPTNSFSGRPNSVCSSNQGGSPPINCATQFTYLPLPIKAKISDISLDLLIAPLGLSSIPEDLSLKDNNVLKNLEESVVRSVNGMMANSSHHTPTHLSQR
jgi:poly(A) polymerase